MEVHAALRLAGRAGGERDDRDVVGGRVDGRERRVAGASTRARTAAPTSRAPARMLARGLDLGHERVLDERVRDLRLADHLRDLARAQQRHRRHDDPAGQQDPEPGRDQPRACSARAAARALPGCEPMSSTSTRATARRARAARRSSTRPVAVHARRAARRAGEQLDRGVEPVRVRQPGGEQVRPRRAGGRRSRAKVSTWAVKPTSRRRSAGLLASSRWAASAARPMISCCTSDAPS